jgi:hypothetical protein
MCEEFVHIKLTIGSLVLFRDEVCLVYGHTVLEEVLLVEIDTRKVYPPLKQYMVYAGCSLIPDDELREPNPTKALMLPKRIGNGIPDSNKVAKVKEIDSNYYRHAIVCSLEPCEVYFLDTLEKESNVDLNRVLF